jgi:hypothetical protein
MTNLPLKEIQPGLYEVQTTNCKNCDCIHPPTDGTNSTTCGCTCHWRKFEP